MRKQNLAGLSNEKIKELIDSMRKGLEVAKEGSEEAKIFKTSIDRALEELTRRQQKKDAPPVPGNTKPAQEMEVPIAMAKPTSPPTPQKSATQSKDSERKEPEHVMFTDILTKTAAPTIEIVLADGRIKEMSEAQLKRKAIDYFRDVLRSNFTIDNYHHSTQFLNCIRFLIGLYKFGNDILPHMTLHPTFNQCGEAMQGRSMELYEHMRHIYEKYKDS